MAGSSPAGGSAPIPFDHGALAAGLVMHLTGRRHGSARASAPGVSAVATLARSAGRTSAAAVIASLGTRFMTEPCRASPCPPHPPRVPRLCQCVIV